MAYQKIGDLTLATSALDSDFIEFEIASSGLSRRITKANFIGATLTGGGIVATGGYTLSVPKTGTAAVGTGTAGRIAEWVTDANTLQASTLVKSGVGVLTLSADSAYTLTVPATGTAMLLGGTQTVSGSKTYTARQIFSTSIGLTGTKASVANNSATNVCDIVIGGGGPLAATYLLAVAVTSAANSSAAVYTVAQGYSAADIDKLSEALFQHSSITLTATANAGSRKVTIGMTQVNPAAQACSITVSVIPLMISSDATITLTML